MSDDFDKDDDLAWLHGSDDEPGEEDDKQIDWEEQQPGDQSGPGGRLGFTTELPWMSDADEPAEAGADEEDDYTWLQEAETAGDQNDDDFELEWLLEAEEPQPPRLPPEQPEWLKRATSELEAAQNDDVPEWLRDAGEIAAEAQEPTTEIASEDIQAALESVEEIDINEVPDWLQGLEDTPRQPASMLDDTGGLSREWLESGAELPDTVESEQTFDEWMIEQAERERVPDLEEETPDLSDLATPGTDAPGEVDAGALPDWFLGMEELNVEDAPEWFMGEQAASDSPDESPLSEWLASQQPPEPEPEAPEPETPEPETAFPGEDLFADLESETLSEEPAFDEDFFADLGTDTGGSLDDVLAALGDEPAPETPEPAGAGDQPDEDFFASLSGEESPQAEDAAEPQAAEEDFFASLGIQPGQAGETGGQSDLDAEFLRALSEADDSEDEDYPSVEELAAPDISAVPDGEFLQSLGIETPDDDDEQFDWFALEEREPEDVADVDAADWLQDLGELDESALAAEPAPAFDAEDDEPLPEMEASGLDDIDTLLASMGGDIIPVPDTGSLLSDDADFDDLFSDPAFSDIEIAEERAEPGPELQPDSPDWLTELGATVGGASAAAMLRQRDDRPLDELPDRLKRLRERGVETTARAADPDALTFVPDMREAAELISSPVRGGGEIVLTPEQQRRVDLLKQLAASEQATAAVAARAVSDQPFLLDEDESLPPSELAESAPAAPARRRVRIKADRLLVALLLAAAVIVPFVTDVRIGDLPPAAFAAGSRQQTVFDTLNQLQPGDRVLVGVEYGPTAAPELDGSARVLFEHILLRRAQPVVVSSNPIALLRADNLLAELGRSDSPLLGAINRDTPLRPNEDYYVTRFITADIIGLRALAQNPAPALATDLNSQPTGLTISSLDEFAQVVIVAERPDDLRAWAEQIAPLTGAPLLAATGYTGEPLIEPYLGSSVDGLLVGFRDAYTYKQMLSGVDVPDFVPLEAEATETIEPAVEATEEATATPEVVDETAEPTQEPTVAPTATPLPTDTPAPTATDAPSATPVPSATATPIPTDTPQPTATSADVTGPAPETRAIARVVADSTVNVRSGPNTSFAPVGSASPGDEFVVLGRNADGSWIQIEYPDLVAGQEAWIAAFLLEISVREVPAPSESSGLLLAMAGPDMNLGRLLRQEVTPTPEDGEDTGTGEETVITEEPAIPEETTPLVPASQAEKRWYAMNLGLVVIIIVIGLGTLVNVGRALLRRGK